MTNVQKIKTTQNETRNPILRPFNAVRNWWYRRKRRSRERAAAARLAIDNNEEGRNNTTEIISEPITRAVVAASEFNEINTTLDTVPIESTRKQLVVFAADPVQSYTEFDKYAPANTVVKPAATQSSVPGQSRPLKGLLKKREKKSVKFADEPVSSCVEFDGTESPSALICKAAVDEASAAAGCSNNNHNKQKLKSIIRHSSGVEEWQAFCDRFAQIDLDDPYGVEEEEEEKDEYHHYIIIL
jgi:hypothetical protein